MWNIVNSLLAGSLVFFGGCISGDLNWNVAGAAGLAAALAAIVQFKKYWDNEQAEYTDCNKTMFSFI